MEAVNQARSLQTEQRPEQAEWKWIDERTPSRYQPLANAVSVGPVQGAKSGGEKRSDSMTMATAMGMPSSDVISVEAVAVDADIPISEGTNTSDNLPTRSLGGASSGLQAVVHKLGIPVIDGRIFDGPPRAVQTLQPSPGSTNTPGMGKKLLNAMYALLEQNVIVHDHLTSGELQSQDFILHFFDLTVPERQLLLEAIFNDHRAAPLTATEIEHLKALPLFSPEDQSGAASSAAERPVAIRDCQGGVYWCASQRILEGIAFPGSDVGAQVRSGTSMMAALAQDRAAPVILINTPELRGLYQLVGAEELTASTAVRRFTLPALNTADNDERLRIMTALSSRYSLLQPMMYIDTV